MAKDYKDAGKPRKSAAGGGGGGKGAPGWIWGLGGFALGVALTVFMQIGQPERARPVSATAPASDAATTAPAADKPKLDFYKMLPKFEVVVPEQEKVVAGSASEAAPAPGTYVLQAGSFRSAADADRLRAQLALIGVEARIEQVTIDAKDTWHRVRIGPLKDGAELQRIQARLAENRMSAMLIRVGD